MGDLWDLSLLVQWIKGFWNGGHAYAPNPSVKHEMIKEMKILFKIFRSVISTHRASFGLKGITHAQDVGKQPLLIPYQKLVTDRTRDAIAANPGGSNGNPPVGLGYTGLGLHLPRLQPGDTGFINWERAKRKFHDHITDLVVQNCPNATQAGAACMSFPFSRSY